MSGLTWAVGGSLAAAVLLALPSAEHRLHRLHRLSGLRGGSGAGGSPPRLPAGAAGLWACRVGRFRAGRRRIVVDGAEVVADLATLLRAGLPPARAWAAVASVDRGHDALDAALAAAAADAAAGGDVAVVLRATAAATADPVVARPLHALSAAWQVAASTGAPTAAVLERLAVALREESDLRDARASAMAAPRASARVLVALPVLGLVLGQLVGAGPLHVLVTSGVGRVCALVGGLASLASWWWTRRLVLAAQRP